MRSRENKISLIWLLWKRIMKTNLLKSNNMQTLWHFEYAFKFIHELFFYNCFRIASWNHSWFKVFVYMIYSICCVLLQLIYIKTLFLCNISCSPLVESNFMKLLTTCDEVTKYLFSQMFWNQTNFPNDFSHSDAPYFKVFLI